MADRRVLGLAFVALGVLSACTAHPGPAREVTLVARGMTFVLADNPDAPNPVLRFRVGERVRLVLENDAPGLLHDVVIPAFGIEIEPIRVGERREVTFTVPEAPGRHEYKCRPHAALMHGIVDVTP